MSTNKDFLPGDVSPCSSEGRGTDTDDGECFSDGTKIANLQNRCTVYRINASDCATVEASSTSSDEASPTSNDEASSTSSDEAWGILEYEDFFATIPVYARYGDPPLWGPPVPTTLEIWGPGGPKSLAL